MLGYNNAANIHPRPLLPHADLHNENFDMLRSVINKFVTPPVANYSETTRAHAAYLAVHNHERVSSLDEINLFIPVMFMPADRATCGYHSVINKIN